MQETRSFLARFGLLDWSALLDPNPNRSSLCGVLYFLGGCLGPKPDRETLERVFPDKGEHAA